MAHAAWGHNAVGQMVLHGLDTGQNVVNVFAFEADNIRNALFTSDDLAQAGFDQILDDWRNNVMSLWMASCVNSYTLPRISMQVVERSGLYERRLTPTERTYTTAITGTYNSAAAGGDLQTPSTAGVIRWRTPQAGKRHRGRTYVPATCQSPRGKVTLLVQDAYTAFATAMLTRYAAGGGGTFTGYSLTIYSRPYDSHSALRVIDGGLQFVTLPDYAGDSTNVTSFQVDPNCRQQRRRQLGVGS